MAEVASSVRAVVRPLAPYGALPRVAPGAKVAGAVGAGLTWPLRVALPPRRPVATPPRTAAVPTDVGLGTPVGALGRHVVPRRAATLAVAALREAAVAVVGERVGRGAATKVYVGRLPTGPSVPTLPDLAAGAVA